MKWALLFLGFFCAPAQAHDWYSGACCNDQDCRPAVVATSSGVAINREVERRPNGWFVRITNELIPFNDQRIKQSQDPNFHLCLMDTWHYPQNGSGAGVQVPKIRCLYVPELQI